MGSMIRVCGVAVLLGAAGLSSGCAHGGLRGGSGGDEPPALSAGRYAVQSIRSRATLEGKEQMLEISESGTRVVDSGGDAHTLTERGALMLSAGGACRLALAVSVDGDEPGVSDRPCTWSVAGDRFFLGDGAGEVRTVYQVRREESRLVLEGLFDLDPEGKVVGDAAGERLVLVLGRDLEEPRPADRTAEPASATAPVPVDEI